MTDTTPISGRIYLITHPTGFEQRARYEFGKWFIPGTERQIHAEVVGWREEE